MSDWGVGGMIRIARGKAGRGLALTVQPAVGETAGGAAHLWGIKDASRLAKEEIEDLDPRVRAEVGYGLDAWGGLLTPYAGLSVSESGKRGLPRGRALPDGRASEHEPRGRRARARERRPGPRRGASRFAALVGQKERKFCRGGSRNRPYRLIPNR